MRRAVLLLSLLLTACSGTPDEADLEGLWDNLDEAAATHRVWDFRASSSEVPEFAGKSHVYTLYLYPKGSPSVSVQRGTYAITEGSLVTTALTSQSQADVGKSFSNGITAFEAGVSFTLDKTTGADGTRTFLKVAKVP